MSCFAEGKFSSLTFRFCNNSRSHKPSFRDLVRQKIYNLGMIVGRVRGDRVGAHGMHCHGQSGSSGTDDRINHSAPVPCQAESETETSFPDVRDCGLFSI